MIFRKAVAADCWIHQVWMISHVRNVREGKGFHRTQRRIWCEPSFLPFPISDLVCFCCCCYSLSACLFPDTRYLNLIWNLTEKCTRKESWRNCKLKDSFTLKFWRESLNFPLPKPEEICNRPAWKEDLKGSQRDLQMSFIFCVFTEDIKKRKDQSVWFWKEESWGGGGLKGAFQNLLKHGHTQDPLHQISLYKD